MYTENTRCSSVVSRDNENTYHKSKDNDERDKSECLEILVNSFLFVRFSHMHTTITMQFLYYYYYYYYFFVLFCLKRFDLVEKNRQKIVSQTSCIFSFVWIFFFFIIFFFFSFFFYLTEEMNEIIVLVFYSVMFEVYVYVTCSYFASRRKLTRRKVYSETIHEVNTVIITA